MVSKNMKENNKRFLDELTSVSDMIDYISEERRREITSLQKKILGKKRVAMSNETRLRRLVSEIESAIEQSAYKIEIVLEELDRTASKMSKADDNLPRVMELIFKGYEALKLKYDVNYDGYLYKTVNYKIENKYKTITTKWKRKYNSLEIVGLYKEDQKAVILKKDISLTKKRIANHTKKKIQYAEQNEEDVESKEQMIEQNLEKLQLLEKNNEEMTEQIPDTTQSMVENEWEKSEIRGEIIVENDEIKNIKKAQTSENAIYKHDIIQLNELLHGKYNERNYLQLQEKTQRDKAQKAIFFKKRKLKEADNILIKINVIENDIRNVNDRIRERHYRYSEFCEKTKNEIDSKVLRINSKEQRLSELNEQNKELKKTIDRFRKEINSNSAMIKKIQKMNNELNIPVMKYRDRVSKYENEIATDVWKLGELERSYNDIMERRGVIQEQVDAQKEIDKEISEMVYNESLIDRIEERINNPDVQIEYCDEEKDRMITSSDFIVRASNYKCVIGRHKLLKVTAVIKVMDSEGVYEVEVPACYCERCDKYYVLEKNYQELKKYGYICCKVDKYDVLLSPSDSDKFSNYKDKSLLMTYGYTVNSNDNLSDKKRQEILKFIISNKIMSKDEIISFLEWLISTKQNNPNNIFAIRKWEKDIEFLNGISRRAVSVMVNKLVVPVKRIKITE